MTREEIIAQKIAVYYRDGISKARYVAKEIVKAIDSGGVSVLRKKDNAK